MEAPKVGVPRVVYMTIPFASVVAGAILVAVTILAPIEWQWKALAWVWFLDGKEGE